MFNNDTCGANVFSGIKFLVISGLQITIKWLFAEKMIIVLKVGERQNNNWQELSFFLSLIVWFLYSFLV